jgi:putative transposase
MKTYPRKYLRLPGFDYSTPGAYFITLNIHKRHQLFSICRDGNILLTDLGRIVEQEWQRTGQLNADVELDEYVIMPDHFHALIWLLDHDGRQSIPQWQSLPQSQDYARKLGGPNARLSFLVNYFKSMVTRRAKRLQISEFRWQARFYDRIVRNEKELDRIRQYIRTNPERWSS